MIRGAGTGDAAVTGALGVVRAAAEDADRGRRQPRLPAPVLALMDELTLTLPRRIRERMLFAVLRYIDSYPGGPAGFVTRARGLAARYGDRFTPPASLIARGA